MEMRFELFSVLTNNNEHRLTAASYVKTVTFSQKKFESKIFNSVFEIFFFFLKLPMARRLRVCKIIGGLNDTYVG